MMTGTVPFGGEGYGEIIVKHLTQAATLASRHKSGHHPCAGGGDHAVAGQVAATTASARWIEFRAAMLDPEKFAAAATARGPAAHAPTMIGNEPSESSGLTPTGASEGSSPRRAPMPSTFGNHGAGELQDDELTPVRSSKTKIIAAVVAAAVAAGVTLLVMNRKQDTPVAAAVAPVAVEAPAAAGPPAPAVPDKVTISFSSLPSGATVSLKDTGEVLGMTPLDKQLPSGKTPLAVVFRKDGYEETEIPLVPTMSTMVNANLRPTPPPAPVAVEEPVARPRHGGPSAGSSARSSSKRAQNTTRKRKSDEPKRVDEDDVLEPSFNVDPRPRGR